MHTLERAQVIPASREEVFQFFEDPRNLVKITPRWMNFSIARSDEGEMRSGFRIGYRIRWLGISLPWVSRIDEYERNSRFVDVQTKGPYRYWRHEHLFEDYDGQTVMTDRVQYRLPFGILGKVTHRLLVARQLQRIFDHRARVIRRMFTAAVEAPVGPEAGSRAS